MAACPNLADVEQLLADGHEVGKLAALEEHLATCAECRERLETLTDVSDLLPERPPAIRPPSSQALARAMQDLAQLAAVHDSSPRPTSIKLNFLTATGEPGFLGKLGDYLVRRLIGQGGMGMVLEAVDPVLRRTVALKILAPWLVADDEAKGRLLREAQAAAQLVHENVVTIHSIEEAQGMPFLVLEYVPGESLADRLDRELKLPLADVQRIGSQVARGLAAAHAKGLVHRDIKPANILLAEDGRVKLADFGLAKDLGQQSQTLPGALMGTPEFMSPEQALGKPGDARSDLFSLGVVLYVMAGGLYPFRGNSLLETLDKVRSCQPPELARLDPSLPAWFTALVHRLLSRDPNARPPSAGEVGQLLEQSLPPAERPAVAQPARRRRKLPLAIGAALIAVAALLGFGYVNSFRQRVGEPPQRNSPPRPAAGFTIAGSDAVHQTLAAVIAAAKDGDTIEVHGDGPYLTPPVSIAGKRLTIRAAAGALPKFFAENPSLASEQGWLQTDSDLRLEGLEVHWSLESSPGMSEADLLGRSIIVCTHGRLSVAHCRIVGNRHNGCIGGSCHALLLRNCHFAAKEGLGVFWRPEPGGELSIDNCVFETRFGINLLMDRAPSTTAPKPLRLSHCSLICARGIQVMMESQPRQPLAVHAEHTLLDCDTLFVVMAQRNPRVKPNPKIEEVGGLLKFGVDWSEEATVHRRGMQYLARPRPGRPGEIMPANFFGLDRWLALWNLTETESVEGEIRYKAREENSPSALPQLDAVQHSGMIPRDIGARVNRVGPGPAYQAWRSSAE